ncbi:MAG: hypothetical protein ISR52_04620 [Rhodospirillales bacterium]|nr:hypothetical protein [Rhodospirillales bacterium]
MNDDFEECGHVLRIHTYSHNPLGLRTVEIDNWSGIAVFGRRTDLASLPEALAVPGPCLYFLMNKPGPEHAGSDLYVGETEDIARRMKNHKKTRPWTEFILFRSKDRSLNRSHTLWLEKTVVEHLRSGDCGWSVLNRNTPRGAHLSKADRTLVRRFFQTLVHILTALGYPFAAEPEHASEEPLQDASNPVQSTPEPVSFNFPPSLPGK